MVNNQSSNGSSARRIVRTPDGRQGEVIRVDDRYARWYGQPVAVYVVGWHKSPWFGSWSRWYPAEQLQTVEGGAK